MDADAPETATPELSGDDPRPGFFETDGLTFVADAYGERVTAAYASVRAVGGEDGISHSTRAYGSFLDDSSDPPVAVTDGRFTLFFSGNLPLWRLDGRFESEGRSATGQLVLADDSLQWTAHWQTALASDDYCDAYATAYTETWPVLEDLFAKYSSTSEAELLRLADLWRGTALLAPDSSTFPTGGRGFLNSDLVEELPESLRSVAGYFEEVIAAVEAEDFYEGPTTLLTAQALLLCGQTFEEFDPYQ